MRHQKKSRKLNRTASHRKALLSNLAASLILNNRIFTTDPKAKELRPFVERLVTYAKLGTVHGRRLILKKIKGSHKKDIANKLIHDIAPNYKNRNGGYTRIIKTTNRKNDNALVSLIEFVDLKVDDVDETSTTSEEK